MMNITVRIVSVFMLGLLVSAASENKEVKKPRFEVRYGFRTRQFDRRTVKWISFWVRMDKKDLKQIREIRVLKNGKRWYTRKDLKNITCPTKGKRALFFWQHGLKSAKDYTARIDVSVVMKSGRIHTVFYKKLEKIAGNVHIQPFRCGTRVLRKKRIVLRFSRREKGYRYHFSIYGPDDRRRFFRFVIGSSIKVDLRGYPAGNYLFCYTKASKENQYNFISREYDVRIVQ